MGLIAIPTWLLKTLRKLDVHRMAVRGKGVNWTLIHTDTLCSLSAGDNQRCTHSYVRPELIGYRSIVIRSP